MLNSAILSKDSALTFQYSIIDLTDLPRRQQDAESSDILYGPLYIDESDARNPDPMIWLNEIRSPESNKCKRTHYILASRLVRQKKGTSK